MGSRTWPRERPSGSTIDRGYGFISPGGGGKDLFVHHSGIEGGGFKSLAEGQKVTYEATQGKKGMQAENVSRA